MPLQNRVLPTGEIVAHPMRGAWTGNRGIIHRPDRTLGTSRWSHRHWIICTLDHPRGVYHGPMPDRRWTALFFADEAVALAAGHRPCAYCRPTAFAAWKAAWAREFGEWPGHKAADWLLHENRVFRNRQQRRHEAELSDLPDGTFVLLENQPRLVAHGKTFLFSEGAYGDPQTTRPGAVEVLTPGITLRVLRNGYDAQVMSSLLA